MGRTVTARTPAGDAVLTPPCRTSGTVSKAPPLLQEALGTHCRSSRHGGEDMLRAAPRYKQQQQLSYHAVPIMLLLATDADD